MANVGYATLTIIPSAKGFGRKLQSETGGAMGAVGTTGGKEAGKRFGGAFIPAVKGFIGPAIGIAAGLGLGKGIASGLRTSAFMEQAMISFETLLGSKGAAEKMLANVSKFAAKTPFELPGLTDNARMLLGAGAAGDSILPTMTALGDATGALGVNQEGLSSIVRAWTQVMGKGKVSAEEMLQITEAGLPIWSILSKAMGKPVGELQKMASEGELLAKDVLPLLEGQMNKDYGGSMAKQAETLGGVWSTVKDTLNMAMAEGLKPLVPLLTTVLPPAAEFLAGAIMAVSDGLVAFATIAGPHVETIGKALKGLFSSGEGGEGGGMFAGLLASLKPLGDIIVGTVLPALSKLASAFVTGIQPVLRVVGEIIQTSVIPAFQDIAEKAGPLFAKLGETISVLATEIGPILTGLADLIRNVWGFIGPFVMSVLGGLVANVIGVFSGLLTVIQGVVTLVSAIFQGDWAKAWEGLKMIVSGAVQAIWNFVQLWLVGRVVGLVGKALGAVKGIFSKVWGSIVSFVKGVGSKLGASVKGFIDGIRLRVMYGLDKVKGFFSKIWNGIVSLVVRVASRIGSSVAGFIGRVRSTVSSGLSAVRSFFSNAWNAAFSLVRGAFLKIVSSVRTGITKVMSYVRGLPGKVKAKLSNLGGLLLKAGSAIIGGLLKGLKNSWKGVTDFVGGIAGWIADNKGPIPYDRRLLIPAGKAIMEGLGKGLEGQLGNLKGTLGTITDSIVDQVHGRIAEGGRSVAKAAQALAPKVPAFASPTIGADGSVAGSVAAAVSGIPSSGTAITLNGVEGDPRAFADALTHALRRARRGGVYAPGGNA